MQDTSALYKEILADPRHWTETILKINGVTYDSHSLVSMKTTSSIFPGDSPELGGCVARKIDATIMKPSEAIPPMALMEPMVRLADGTRNSEWLPKGKFYIDTRQEEDVSAESDGLHMVGYCRMMFAECDCPINIDWPASDIDVVRMIAQDLDVELDQRTVNAINRRYTIQIPTGYSSREVLGAIAAMYGGSFIMSDEGKLLLIQLDSMPEETFYLINNHRDAITFGGVRILV